MSKKDYILIAETISAQLETSSLEDGHPDASYNEGLAIKRTAHALADAFAADNPRFDRDRFLIACGASR